MYCFMVFYARDYFAFGNKSGLFMVSNMLLFLVGELTKATSNNHVYEELAQLKKVTTVIDCSVIPANIG